MYSLFFQLLVGCNFYIRGYLGFESGSCVTSDEKSTSQYISCTGNGDRIIYPGRITTLALDFYIPNGLTLNATTYLDTDLSLLISGISLDHQADLSLENSTGERAEYMPYKEFVHFSTRRSYNFGNMSCTGSTVYSGSESVDDGSTLSPTSTNASDNYCLVKLTVAYLMANPAGVSDNSTRIVTMTFNSTNATITATTAFVLRTITKNVSEMSSFTTNFPEGGEFSARSFKTLQIKALFPNPLSLYMMKLVSFNETLRVASVRIPAAGDHYRDILITTIPPTIALCYGGFQTKDIDFGFLPNKGAYDDDASSDADVIDIEVKLLLTEKAVPGEIHILQINLEVDFVSIMTTTKYFNVTGIIPVADLNVKTSQSDPLISKSGTGQAYLTLNIPQFSFASYHLDTSTELYPKEGQEGLPIVVSSVHIVSVGSNLPCTGKKESLKSNSLLMNIGNVVYTSGTGGSDDTMGFIIYVVAEPDIVAANSSHELSVKISYPGDGSPELLKFYFNVSDEEIFTVNVEDGFLPPLHIGFYTVCQSLTHSTLVNIELETESEAEYGQLLAEFPTPSSVGESFTLCAVPTARTDLNVISKLINNITKNDNGTIEQAFVHMSPLTNIYERPLKADYANRLWIYILVTFIDKSIQMTTSNKSFTARIISNNKTIWERAEPIYKPTITYHEDFIVVTAFTRDIPRTLVYHYSLNGTYYYQQEIPDSENGYLFNIPKVIAYFYYTTDCIAVCDIHLSWLPLSEYVTFARDDSKILLRKLPYALDQDLNTCFDLPVPGDSPSKLWLRVTRLDLFNVTSKRFTVHFTGEGIECARIGQKSLLVGTSSPATNGECSMESSDFVFCKLLSENYNSGLTGCDVQCECDTLLKCSNVHIIMQSTNSDSWRLCELTMNDV